MQVTLCLVICLLSGARNASVLRLSFSIACSIRATYDMPAGELQQTMQPAPQKAHHAQTHQPLNQRWCICYHARDRQHAQMLRRSY